MFVFSALLKISNFFKVQLQDTQHFQLLQIEVSSRILSTGRRKNNFRYQIIGNVFALLKPWQIRKKPQVFFLPGWPFLGSTRYLPDTREPVNFLRIKDSHVKYSPITFQKSIGQPVKISVFQPQPCTTSTRLYFKLLAPTRYIFT